MICLICRRAELAEGLTSVTFARDEIRVLIRNVPARICPSCREVVVEESVAARLLNLAKEAAEAGMNEVTLEYGAVEN